MGNETLIIGRQKPHFNTGKNNGSWKGKKAGRVSIHEYIRRRKIRPLLCEFCKKKKPRVLAKKVGEKYDRNPNHYFWLCDKCHFEYDSIPEKISKTRIKQKIPSPNKGKKVSKKIKIKMSLNKKRLFKLGKLKIWNKGLTGEEYKKHYPNGLNHYHNDESKRKQRETMKRLYKYGKIKTWNKGKSLSKTHKRKISETKKRLYAEGKLIPWFKGKKLSKDYRKKISEARKKFFARRQNG